MQWLIIVGAWLREATRRQRVRRRRRVRRGRRRGRRGRRRRALRRRQRGVYCGPRRLVRRRVWVAARVVERRVVSAAVQVWRVGRGGAARGRIVAGPVGRSRGRVHRAARRLGLGSVVRRRRVRVRPARLARREVALYVQLYRSPEAFARMLRHAQYAALTESNFGWQQIVTKLVRE